VSIYDVGDDPPSRPQPPSMRPVVVRPAPNYATPTSPNVTHVGVPIWSIVLILVLMVAVQVLTIVYFVNREHASPPTPVPSSTIATAAKDYSATLPAAFGSIADAIDSGSVADKQGVFTRLQSHAQPLASAMDSALKPMLDDKGAIKDRAGASVLFRTAATSLAKGK
jgi:hypothetical protein